MKALRILLVLSALVSAAPATGADKGGNYAIWGVGGRSCNQFVKAASEEASALPYRHFLMGYLTAFNALAPDTYDSLSGMKLTAALEWLGNYCQEHRMDSFERAVAQAIVSRSTEVEAARSESANWGRAPAAAPATGP